MLSNFIKCLNFLNLFSFLEVEPGEILGKCMKLAESIMEFKSKIMNGLSYLDKFIDDMVNNNARDIIEVEKVVEDTLENLKERFERVEKEIDQLELDLEELPDDLAGVIKEMLSNLEDFYKKYEDEIEEKFEDFIENLEGIKYRRIGALRNLAENIKKLKENCKAIFGKAEDGFEAMKSKLEKLISAGKGSSLNFISDIE